MYTSDKNHRITLRLTDEQFSFVKDNSDMLDVSPSEFLRMVICSSMAVAKAAKNKIEGGLNGRENDKANLDNLV